MILEIETFNCVPALAAPGQSLQVPRTLTPKCIAAVFPTVSIVGQVVITPHLGWGSLTDLSDPSLCQRKFVLHFVSVLFFLFVKRGFDHATYFFAGKSSVRTHFTPDQGQIPSQGIQCFSRSDPNLPLKTNYQQVSGTRPLLRPLWKFSFLTCLSLARFFLAFSPSRTELIFSRGHPVSHGETYNWNPGILSLNTCSSWLFA